MIAAFSEVCESIYETRLKPSIAAGKLNNVRNRVRTLRPGQSNRESDGGRDAASTHPSSKIHAVYGRSTRAKIQHKEFVTGPNAA